jgi:hypothetical protein
VLCCVVLRCGCAVAVLCCAVLCCAERLVRSCGAFGSTNRLRATTAASANSKKTCAAFKTTSAFSRPPPLPRRFSRAVCCARAVLVLMLCCCLVCAMLYAVWWVCRGVVWRPPDPTRRRERMERDRVSFEAERLKYESQVANDLQRYRELQAVRAHHQHHKNVNYCQALAHKYE